METETKLKIKQRLFGIVLVLLIIIYGTQNFQPFLSDLQKINVTQTWPTQLHSAMALQL